MVAVAHGGAVHLYTMAPFQDASGVCGHGRAGVVPRGRIPFKALRPPVAGTAPSASAQQLIAPRLFNNFVPRWSRWEFTPGFVCDDRRQASQRPYLVDKEQY